MGYDVAKVWTWGGLWKLCRPEGFLCIHQILRPKSSIWSHVSSSTAIGVGCAAVFLWNPHQIAEWSDLGTIFQSLQRVFGLPKMLRDALGRVWAASNQLGRFSHSWTGASGCQASYGFRPIGVHRCATPGGGDRKHKAGDRIHGIVLPWRPIYWRYLSGHSQDQAFHGNGWLRYVGALWRYLRIALWHAQSAARNGFQDVSPSLSRCT